jgi:tetratricopeptide (TPR) repeat protein
VATYFPRRRLNAIPRRLDRTLKSYDKAVEYNPRYAIAWNNRGKTLEELNRDKEALQSYDRALKIKSDYETAIINRQNLLEKLKDDTFK